jgi:hypothetical protein
MSLLRRGLKLRIKAFGLSVQLPGLAELCDDNLLISEMTRPSLFILHNSAFLD